MDFVWSRERSRFPDDFYGGGLSGGKTVKQNRLKIIPKWIIMKKSERCDISNEYKGNRRRMLWFWNRMTG